MADSMVLMHGPEIERPFAEKAGSRNGKWRILEYLSMVVMCVVISFAFFFMLDRIFMHSSDSGRAALAESSLSDESVEQVKTWIQQNRQEGATIEFMEWSPVREVKDSGFSVRTKYLTRTPSGKMTIGNKVFFLDSRGNVINVWTMAW